MTALFEQDFRMGLLEISGADFGRRDLRRNRKHGHARAVAVKEAVDEVQIAGATAASANGELARQMRLGAGRERGDLLVPDVDPLDLALPAQGVGEAVEAVADNAIDPLDARCGQGLDELVGYQFHHIEFPPSRCRKRLLQPALLLSLLEWPRTGTRSGAQPRQPAGRWFKRARRVTEGQNRSIIPRLFLGAPWFA